MTQRTFAIPDIHGCLRQFAGLIEHIRLQRDDTLFLLGDYIDRGPDSSGVIKHIMDLQADGYDVRPVRGNHEAMLLDALDNDDDEERLIIWLINGGNATLKSYGVDHPSMIPDDHLEFIRQLPCYHLTDTHLFVHAGIDSYLQDPLSPEGGHAMLWDRSGIVDIEKIGRRKVVSGHTMLPMDEVVQSLDTSYVRLDNGCVLGPDDDGIYGTLVALELGTMQLFSCT